MRECWLVDWPRLTIDNINAWIYNSSKTQQGYMKQQREGVISTKKSQHQNLSSKTFHLISVKRSTAMHFVRSGTAKKNIYRPNREIPLPIS